MTEDIREWDYGDYEGVTSPEIRKMRAEQGYEGTWDIWRDGCPGGEYVPPAPLPVNSQITLHISSHLPSLSPWLHEQLV